MKNLKKNSIILFFITLVVLFFILKDDFVNIIMLLMDAKFFWIFIGFGSMMAYIFFESLALYQIIKSYNIDYSLFQCFKLCIITKFFNGITPFSAGGQPLQVYLMKKDGIRVTKSTNIIMQNFIIFQLALVTFGILAVVFNNVLGIFSKVSFLRILVIFGFSLNILVMIILFVISFSNRFNKFIVNFIIKIMSKFGLVKDVDKEKEKWAERCNDFHDGAILLKNNKKLCFECYIYNLISLVFYYIVPFFVALSLLHSDTFANITILNTLVASTYVMIIGSFIPIPGASGGIEYGFMHFFGHFLTGNILSATLLIWRFVTYYIPMILGAILFNIRKEEIK